jgi:putative ABC transport system substrate-binding protein
MMGGAGRRDFLKSGAALIVAACPGAARAQGKVARIGFMSTDLAGNPRGADAFRRGLRDLGYVEGRNIVIEFGDAARQLERFPALAAELVAANVDVIFAPNVFAAQAARGATSSIPIVFAGVADPVSDGLVASLARPGGNVTGLSNLAPELAAKRLGLLKEAIPRVRRVAVLWQPGSGMERTDRGALASTEVAARRLGVELMVVGAKAPAELDAAFAGMARERADALMVLGTPMFFVERQRIVTLTSGLRLPAMYSGRDWVDAGGLMSYGANLNDLLRRAATYVDKILKGAKPGDLPVEQPTKFELVINLKAAKTLGAALAPAVLARADELIQ